MAPNLRLVKTRIVSIDTKEEGKEKEVQKKYKREKGEEWGGEWIVEKDEGV